jgi:hypothetical protein
MDQTPLVNSDIEIEGKLVSALSRARVPVTAVDWNWVPQLEESQLVVVTPLVDTLGPRATYARILEALSLAGLYQSMPIRKLLVKSPGDPASMKLIAELKRSSYGAIYIVRDANKSGGPQYILVFAPYVGSGRAIPSKRLAGNSDLRHFLEKRIGIRPFAVDQALAELAKTGSTTIFNVQLSQRRLKKLDLAA